jgi:Spy/CpxP family protein refolding chaperone
MLTKTKIAGLVVALMALSAPMVYADNGAGDKDSWHQGDDMHHGQHEHMLAKILNLSDDQVKQLKDIHQKQKEAMKSTFEQMKSNREAFEAEIVKATPDMGKINDIETQIKTLQSQMVDNHLNSLLAVKKVMTPEQFAGYMALNKARMMMMHDRHHQFGHRNGFGKDGNDHKNWGDQGDKGHSSDD